MTSVAATLSEMLRRLYTRARELDDQRADLALALVLTAAALIEVALSDPGGDSRLATYVAVLLGLPFPLAWRRRDPLAAALVFAAVAVGQEPFDTFYVQSLDVSFVTLLILLYTVGRHLDGKRLWLATAALVVGTDIALAFDPDLSGPGDVIWPTVLLLPPVLAGHAVRSRRRLQAELRERARRAEEDQEARAAEAVIRERDRIAEELQAVVANAVSAIVVQAETVPRSLEAERRAQAADTFGVIEETGRDALAEMRRLLGVLRRDGDRPELAPQPGLARLAALVDRMREEDGLEVEILVDGDERQPAPGVDLTAYRVVQDALEAAAEKGATRATVELRYGARDLDLAVRDDRTGGASHRLPALRDRVGLYGGHLRAGRAGDEFALESRLPLQEAAA